MLPIYPEHACIMPPSQFTSLIPLFPSPPPENPRLLETAPTRTASSLTATHAHTFFPRQKKNSRMSRRASDSRSALLSFRARQVYRGVFASGEITDDTSQAAISKALSPADSRLCAVASSPLDAGSFSSTRHTLLAGVREAQPVSGGAGVMSVDCWIARRHCCCS